MTDNTPLQDSPKEKEKDYSYKNRFLGSLLALFIAFSTVNLTHQLIQTGASKLLGYETKLNFVRVDSSPKQNEFWSDNRVHALYLMPVVFSLLLAVACFSFLEYKHLNSHIKEGLNKRKTIHLLLFWVGICSFNLAASQFLSIPFGRLNPDRNLFYQDLSVVANWHSWSGVAGVAIAALTFLFSLIVGYYAGKHFYKKFSFTKRVLTNTKGLLKFTWWLYFLPAALLLPFSVVLTYPLPPFLHLIQVFNLFWICVGVYSFIELRKAKLMLQAKAQDVANLPDKNLVIALIVLTIAIKLFL